MAQVTPNMQLAVWNDLTDPYDPEQLATNFVKIDLHDHSPGKGAPIDGSSIVNRSITANKLAANSVTTGVIADNTVQTSDLKSTSGSEAVDTNVIRNLAVTEDKIANGAVTGNKLSSLIGITKDKLADSAKPLYIDGTNSAHNTITSALTAAYPTITPTESTELYYKAASSIIWHFRYKSGATYPWEFVGGSSLISTPNNASESSDSWQYSSSAVIRLPYALTGGIFDVTVGANITVSNDNTWNLWSATSGSPTNADINTLVNDLKTNVVGSYGGALISYGWYQSDGNLVISNADAFSGSKTAYYTTQFAFINSSDPTAYISRTCRETQANNLSYSIIKFAQRKQDITSSGTASINGRTIQVRPVAIK